MKVFDAEELGRALSDLADDSRPRKLSGSEAHRRRFAAKLSSKASLQMLGGAIACWALVGTGLILLADLFVERLFFLALVPWVAWVLAGLLLLGLTVLRAHWDGWHPRSLLFVSFPFLVVLLLWCGARPLYRLGAASVCCEHPSDLVLIERFNLHRADFEHLRQMFLLDRQLGRVAPGFTRSASFFSGALLPPGPVVTNDRLSEYRKLFEALGLDAGIEGYDDKPTISFIASARGLSISGSSKGYIYTSKPPEPVLPTLGTILPDGRQGTAYRHLEGNWYLYLSAD